MLEPLNIHMPKSEHYILHKKHLRVDHRSKKKIELDKTSKDKK